MGDAMSAGGGASDIGMGLMNYLGAIQANKNARAVNATSNKWAPLLALNGSRGKSDEATPTASFAKIMGPAIYSAMNSGNIGKDMAGGMGGGGGGGGGGAGKGLASLDTGALQEPMGGATGAGAGMNFGFMAGGGQVPKYAGGGMMGMLDPAGLMGGGGGDDKGGGGGGMSSIMSLLPMLAMLAPGGGMVPGQENVPGDSLVNDTKLIGASPGEIVLPKSVVNSPNKWDQVNYVNKVKKHGPGPMPVKPKGAGMKSASNKKPSSSMSPWAAMCGGGMTR